MCNQNKIKQILCHHLCIGVEGKITSYATVPLIRISLPLCYSCHINVEKENDLLPSTVPLSPGVASHWQAVEQMLTQFCQCMYSTCTKCMCFIMYIHANSCFCASTKTSFFVIFPFETEK